MSLFTRIVALAALAVMTASLPPANSAALDPTVKQTPPKPGVASPASPLTSTPKADEKTTLTKPAPESAVPADVPAKHPARSAVDGMVKKAIIRPADDGKFHGDKPVTRYELAVILNRFITYIETTHKPIQETKYAVPVSALTAPAGHWARESQVRLLRDGFIGSSSPILKEPGTALVTAKDLAIVMSTVTSELSSRSLPPTPGIPAE